MKKLLLMLPFFFLAACGDDNGTTPTKSNPPVVEIQNVPEIINPGKTYKVSVRVQSEQMVEFVQLQVLADDVWFTAELYDDGGSLHDDGDVIARDGIFTQNVTIPSTAIAADNVIFSFTATDDADQTSESAQQTVEYNAGNIAPIVTVVEAPELLASGFDGELVFRAEVSDENGLEDIARVEYQAYLGDLLSFTMEMTQQSPGVYTHTVDSAFAIGISGDFVYHFYAIDKSGDKSNEVTKSVTIENKAPRVLEVVHSDSVKRPPLNSRVGLLVQVLMNDDQSLEDIVAVKMDWKKPDGTFSGNSPFDLYDNGLPLDAENLSGWDQGYRGDLEAGDGIYSITAMFDDDDEFGEYELTFYATDFAGNTSEKMTTQIILY